MRKRRRKPWVQMRLDAAGRNDVLIRRSKVKGFYSPPKAAPVRVFTAEELACENARRATMQEE